MTVFIFIIVLSVLILIHELGHFLAAKKAGVKVEEFALGFPPRIFRKKIGETVYSINALPFGGFVRLFGEDEPTKTDQRRSFFAQSLPTKLIVALAGALMNFFLGVLIFAFLYSQVGVPQKEVSQVAIGQVIPGTPAEAAGFRDFDRILTVSGRAIGSVEELKSVVGANLGKEVQVEIDRAPIVPLAHKTIARGEEQKTTLKVTPRSEKEGEPATIGVRPMVLPLTYTKFYSPPEMIYRSMVYGVTDSISFAKQIFFGIGGMLQNLVVKREVPQDVSGPVGIAQIVGEVYKIGFLPLLSLVGVLSINLAVLNALPFPGLDGARAFFVIVQGVTRQRISPNIEKNIHLVGLALLFLLIILISVRDVGRLFG